MSESDRSQVFREGLLEGQVCVVSGAGSGLGRETALELVRLGATLVACGRREEPLGETAALPIFGIRTQASECRRSGSAAAIAS